MGMKRGNRVLVNIRGCNGSGKSTIPMSMMNDPNMWVHTIIDDTGKKLSAITVFPSYGWVALGTYFNKTGGMDTLRNNEITRLTLQVALEKFQDFNILMEGIMASTIRSTYIDLFHEVENTWPVRVIVLNLLPPVEIAISRVYSRNGGKAVKEDAIRSKWNTVSRNAKAFADEGFISIRVDSSKVQKENMLKAFFRTVKKYGGGS